MKVMLVESRIDVAADVRERLVEAGYEVVRCFDDEGTVGCRGANGEPCPVDDGQIDVALLVRDGEPRAQLTEMGAVCALRRHIPVAQLGAPGPSPFAGALDVVDANPAAVADFTVAAGLDAFAAEVTRVLHTLPGLAGRSPDECSAQVFRHAGGVDLVLWLPADLDAPATASAVTWAARAARDYDGVTPVIDVSVRRT
jgi:hypothetical protein